MAKRNKSRPPKEIVDYDSTDTVGMITKGSPLRLADIGFQLPETPPTQVISIRLPSSLLNQLRAIASQKDVPYQALIKLYLAEAIEDQAA